MAYDVIVIGSGPGGYVCAIRAAQLGLKTAVVEKNATFGGTCLNVGCIPSKAMLHASELYEEAGHSFAQMGIKVGKPSVELPALLKYKEQNVEANVKGVEFLFKKNKIDAFHGAARIAAPGRIEVKDGGGMIGLELGSVWRRLGAQVTIVEFLDHILPGIDGEVARQFHRMLQKQGITFKLSSKVTAIDTSATTLKVKV